MSEPDGIPEGWRQSVQDMIVFCERILDHTTGIDQSTMVARRLAYDAVLWNIALLGEATRNVPDAVKALYPAIPWSVIGGTRDKIIHQYWGIDSDIVWDIVRNDVPDLLPRLTQIVESE